MQDDVRVGETVVDGCELFLVIERDEAFACGRVKLLCFDVLIAPEIEITDVVLDLSGGEQVVMLQEHFARAQGTGDRFVVKT